MRASILDLRYRTKEILSALRNREKVTILYHGVETGVIHPVGPESPQRRPEDMAFFGMYAGEKESVERVMERLRKKRHDL